jgi:hypothetical protein
MFTKMNSQPMPQSHQHLRQRHAVQPPLGTLSKADLRQIVMAMVG